MSLSQRRVERVRKLSEYLRLLGERVLVFDGAMGTQLMALELTADDFGGAKYHGCNEALVLSRPDVVRSIHEAYLAAGADAVETDSFMGSRLKLEEYGLGERTHEINFKSAQLAREACDKFSTPDRPRFVAGSMGPTGMLISSSDPTLSKITFEQLRPITSIGSASRVAHTAEMFVPRSMRPVTSSVACA